MDHISTEGAVAPAKYPRKPPGRRGRLPEDGQLLIGVDAAARMLGISSTYAYKMIRAGDLGAVDIGKRTLVKVSEIAALIERKTRRPVVTSAA